MPVSSLAIYRQCIIGIVVLDEIDAEQAAELGPHIPILDGASQILHITQRVVWREPFKVTFLKRFDRWPQLSMESRTQLHLHAERMASSMLTVPKAPELNLDALMENQDTDSDVPDSGDEPRNLTEDFDGAAPPLQRHERSTFACELYAPAVVIRAVREVVSYSGISTLIVKSFAGTIIF